MKLTIGKVAGLVKVSTDTLRYYEREGLINPSSKSNGGYRLYDHEAVRRLRFIRQAQRCGFTLTEIRALLAMRTSDAACCSDVRRLAVEKKLRLESNIKAMKEMSKALDYLIAACSDESRPLNDCPILAAFDNGPKVKEKH